jgi:hypothetical protein
MSGAILDVIVDLRAGSPTFCQWEAVRLDDADRRAVFLSEGLGHAFMALTDEATVMYLCSTPYAPGREHGVHPLDPALEIAWPLDEAGGAPVLSGKDAAAPTLAEALRTGQLPRYEDCAAYQDKLRTGGGDMLARLARGQQSDRYAVLLVERSGPVASALQVGLFVPAALSRAIGQVPGFGDRIRWRLARCARSRLTSVASNLRASGVSISSFSSW